ncbi:MAG: hypothetical protein IPL23_24290 [Saprospiraceae bacterium]|nr:hypothetical protein [Saprospiraceae bacterium]
MLVKQKRFAIIAPGGLLQGQDPSEDDDEDTVILRPLVVDVSLDQN